jgi:subtilisin family serine protease
VTKGTASLSIATGGNTRGHSGATNAICVGAVDVGTAYPDLFVEQSSVEMFSSDGPRQVFFQADGTPITPDDFSATGGAIRRKPELAAADGVMTSVPGFQPFFGTSAAAPHAAAIAALLLSFNSAITPDDVRSALTNTALDIELPGSDVDSGAGIPMPLPALSSIYPLLQPTLQPIAFTNDTFVFSWNARTGHNYQVQYKLDLANGPWTDAGSPLSATNSPMVLTDATTTDPHRFYRVLLLP